MTLPEHKRLRAVRFGRFMDRIDGDWRVPAQLERVARLIFVHFPRI